MATAAMTRSGEVTASSAAASAASITRFTAGYRSGAPDENPVSASVLHHPRWRRWHALVRVRAPLRGAGPRGADGIRPRFGGCGTPDHRWDRGLGRARRLLRLHAR